jgi:polyhydroxyalkanoate synthesis regulator phasin
MGQSNPPGDNVPLIEGLGPEWNDIVSAIPEDKRGELGPKLKERVSAYDNQLKEYEPWAQFQKSGINPQQVGSALDLYTVIENNPREVYDTIGKHLGLTPAEAKAVVDEAQKQQQTGVASTDPQLVALQNQVETMSQIMLAQRQMSAKEQAEAQAEVALESDLSDLKKKYGDYNENEIIMRMLHQDMTAEEAYQDYSGFVDQIRSRRPSPMVMGSGGHVPTRTLDPTKLDSKQTKNLVAQMMEQANAERNN